MKTNYLKLLFTTAMVISLCSCSSDDTRTKRNNGVSGSSSSIIGSYNLESITSDISVDLNNDGFDSTDLFNEIDPSFFSSTSLDLEIKPVVYNNHLENIMSFYLPHPSVTITTPNKPGSVKFSRNGLGYVFAFDNKTQIISPESTNTTPDPEIAGNMISVKVISKGKIQGVFKKYYYDFKTAKWIALTITCIYLKN